MITIRQMRDSELIRISEIDRSEEVSQDYFMREGALHMKEVKWSIPAWTNQGEGNHSVPHKISEWQPWVEEGGTMLGAFDGDSLAGFSIYRPDISEGVDQLAVLHVSRSHRRKGVGVALAAEVIKLARNNDARQIYVSSAPTKGTVDFYQSLGFQLADEVNQELFELEPEDIHMTMEL